MAVSPLHFSLGRTACAGSLMARSLRSRELRLLVADFSSHEYSLVNGANTVSFSFVYNDYYCTTVGNAI